MASKTFAQKLVQQRTGRDVEALLRELYVDKRYSEQEIANALGVSRGSIQTWRKAFGISRPERPPLALTEVEAA